MSLEQYLSGDPEDPAGQAYSTGPRIGPFGQPMESKFVFTDRDKVAMFGGLAWHEMPFAIQPDGTMIFPETEYKLVPKKCTDGKVIKFELIHSPTAPSLIYRRTD